MAQNTYTVHFDTNGGKPLIRDRTRNFGERVGPKPSSPAKTGYDFDKWIRRVNGIEQEFNENDKLDAPGTIYYRAKWNPKLYRITWRNGNNIVRTQQLSYGSVLKQYIPDHDNRTGYDFVGWYTQADGGTKVTNLTQVTGDATYYARWKIQVHTVTFKMDDIVVLVKKIQHRRKIGDLPENPSKRGYTFKGWRYGAYSITSSTECTTDMTVEAYLTPFPYNITYVTPVGEVPETDNFPRTYTIASNTIIPAPLSHPGYTFNGWTPTEIAKESTGNRKFTASWTKNKYTLVLDYSTNQSWTYNDVEYGQTYEQILGEWPQPQMEENDAGYRFLGWSAVEQINKDNIKISNSLIQIADRFRPTTSETHIHPQRYPETYTVTLDSDGGSPESYDINILYNKTLSELDFSMPGDPQKEGYEFREWFNDSEPDGSKQFNEDTRWTKASNFTYYAKWTPITYTVTYNGNGNTAGTMPNSTHTYDLTQTLSPNQYVREYLVGFESDPAPAPTPSHLTGKAQFLGWAESATSDVKYTDREPVVNLCTEPGTINLYAQWELGEITLPEVSKEGYTMLGWFTEASGGTKVGMPGDKYTPNEPTTLHAQWEQNTYTITLDANGGLPPIKTVNIRFNDQVGTVLFTGVTEDSQTKSELVPIYLGYDFKGWKDSRGSDVKGNTTYTYAGDSTYYAVWDRSKISITFKRGAESTEEPGGTVIYTVDKNTASYAPKIDTLFSLSELYSSINSEISSLILPPTATGKNFLGWARSPSSPDPECGGQSKPNIVSFSQDTTLYAIWEEAKCRVKFVNTLSGTVEKGENGSVPGTDATDGGCYFLDILKNTAFGLGKMPVATTTEERMHWLGWFTAPTGGTIVTGNTPIVDSVKLFAQWTSEDAISSYQSRSQDLDEYLKELLGKEGEDGKKTNPAEERRKANAALFANNNAFRTSADGLELLGTTRVTMYFYTDGSSESACRHQADDGVRVPCDRYKWTLSVNRYKTSGNPNEIWHEIPILPMMDMRGKTWQNYVYPKTPLWTKVEQTSPGWVLMDMTKNNGWGKAMETGLQVHHTKKLDDSFTFATDVTYFNYVLPYYAYSNGGDEPPVKQVYINSNLIWNGCYSFWADFSPKANAAECQVGDSSLMKRVWTE